MAPAAFIYLFIELVIEYGVKEIVIFCSVYLFICLVIEYSVKEIVIFCSIVFYYSAATMWAISTK